MRHLGQLAGIVWGVLQNAVHPLAALGILFLYAYLLLTWITPHEIFIPFEIRGGADHLDLNTKSVTEEFIDRLSVVTSTPVAWRRPAIATSWSSSEIVVPEFNISIGALAEVLKSLVGAPDLHISGEIISTSDNGCPNELRLRVANSRGIWTSLQPSMSKLTQPSGISECPLDDILADLFDSSARALLM